MGVIRGSWRVAAMGIVIGVGTAVILATAWIPVRIQGVRLCAWPITAMARLFTRVFGIEVEVREPEKFRAHHGFVFPNHASFVDIILLVHVLPMRFVSGHAIRSWPFIGWIARAIDTVFVDRGDKSSREATRQALIAASHYPPVALFPEGGILGMEKPLHPFRYGAFEIAAQGSVPFLPCALLYEPLPLVYWGDEPFWTAVWRLAKYSGPVQARLVALHTVHPRPDESAKQLALEAHGAMMAVLAYAGQEDAVIQSGI